MTPSESFATHYSVILSTASAGAYAFPLACASHTPSSSSFSSLPLSQLSLEDEHEKTSDVVYANVKLHRGRVYPMTLYCLPSLLHFLWEEEVVARLEEAVEVALKNLVAEVVVVAVVAVVDDCIDYY